MFHLPRRDAPAIPEAQDPRLERHDEDCRGCGWFDSSHDLRQGLHVQEHTSLAEVSALLPLADWLQLHGSTWQPATLQSSPLWA